MNDEAGQIKLNRRALRDEVRDNGAAYVSLSDDELRSISYSVIAEMQRRYGDRSTINWLAYLVERLLAMAQEIRLDRARRRCPCIHAH
jgi:hypothetical protein